MEFIQQQHGQVMILELQGQRLDAYHAAALKQSVLELLQQGHNKLVLDFSRVRFLDSGGLGVLVDLNKRLRAPAGLVLCQIQERTINDVLRLTRMDQVLNIVADQKQAINAFD